MTVLMIAMLALATLTMLAARHHHQVVSWHRELERAFGVDVARELPRHGTL